MKRISAYSISLLIIVFAAPVSGQDSLKVPLSIRGAFDIYGPSYNISNPDIMTLEGYIAFDRDLKKSYVIETGVQNFKYSQYNYKFLSKGMFFRVGADFNLIKPYPSEGKYYAGVGLRYGMSFYSTEVPAFNHDNYWGTGSSSISSSNHIAYFIEADPGIRTQLFKYLSVGFNVRLRLMLYTGASKDLKPINVPGFGNGTKTFSPGINYYISINIPYKSTYARQEIEKAPEKEEAADKNKNGSDL